MRIQARDIIRFAKKNGMTLRRGGVATLIKAAEGYRSLSSGSCAVSVLASMHGFRSYTEIMSSYKDGKESFMIRGLECGFEGYGIESNNPVYLRYYKVGQKVAKMAGIQ